MGKKIDLTSTDSAQLTDNTSAEVIAGTKKNDLEYLKSLGARALPLDPTAAGWDPKSIKKQLYKQAEVLFAWLKNLAASQKDLGTAIDNYLYALSIGKETPKVYASLAAATTAFTSSQIVIGSLVFINTGADVTCYYASSSGLTMIGQSMNTVTQRIGTAESDIDSLEVRMDTAETDIQNNKTEEATHHHIKTDGSGYAVQEFPSNENPGQSTSEERLMNHSDGVAVNSSLNQLNASINAMLLLRTQEGTRIDKIVDGSTKVGASSNADTAHKDSNGDTINALQYGKSLLLGYNAESGVITIRLVNQAGTVIDTKTVDLPAELVFTAQGYDSETHSLWFTPASGGNNIVIPLSDLIDTYTAGTTATCSVSIDNHVISVSILDGSITLAKMSTALQNTINGWATAESNRVTSENGRVSAEAQRVLNENARLAAPHLFIDTDSYISINYGSGNDVTID